MTLWVLGDQLNHAAVRRLAPRRVLLTEAYELGRTPPMHPQKLALFFSAMRHFAQELRQRGLEVTYLQAETLKEALARFFHGQPGETLVQMQPADYGFAERVRALVEGLGGAYKLVPNPLWLLQPEEFDRWAADRTTYRLEHFYRYTRRRTGYLMQKGRPLGGAWNYDAENRETPPPGYQPELPLRFAPDELTQQAVQTVQERFTGHFGALAFDWPVTRQGALQALEDFVQHRLAGFGPYQDALLEQSWSINHSLLSPVLNLGLLHPQEVVERALAEYEKGGIPLSSIEGFIRQVIGWREYIFHVYRREMPGLAQANQLKAERPLPPLFWGAPTRMRCLSAVIARVQQRGYAHHIERLMVLANFALLYGVNPQELNAWFVSAFVDSADWVMVPNVLGMGVFASPVLSSKPYAASGKYIARMGNHCKHCSFRVEETLGEQACPFNSLYWDFMAQHRSQLEKNPRLAVLYKSWDRRNPKEQEAIRQQARHLRQRIAQGEL